MDNYIEQKIKEYAIHVYGGEDLMPAYNKQAMRRALQDYDRYVANEEREHSHSPVGDEFNMGVNQQ